MSIFDETKIGKVTWDGLKTELLKQDKETLVEMINMSMRNYWTNQSYWMVTVEREFGFNAAAHMDMEIWQTMAAIQTSRLRKLVNIGDDVQALCTALKMTALQWVSAGFDWQFLSIEDRRLTMQVNKCPMGTFRDSKGLELMPCKCGGDTIYRALAKAVNPKFEVRCLHAHPDPRIENVMCEWEFILEDQD